MKIISSTREMQSIAEAARRGRERIAFVPTMGYLHEGHLSLMREGRRRATLLVASIFVNPTQFGPLEDLSRYPRDLERDLSIMRPVPVDVVYTPSPEEVYTSGFQTWVEVSEVTRELCGAGRPGHFRGVTTVVAKLFNIVKPHVAIFGQKDFQQLRAIQRMVLDLNFDIEIVAGPTVREADGLAMSSRNAYLTADQRRSALALNRALLAARGEFGRGVRDPRVLLAIPSRMLSTEPEIEIEYLELLDAETLKEASEGRAMVLAVAAKVGKTRLIDNVILEANDFDQRAFQQESVGSLR